MPQETVGFVKLEWTCKRCGSKNPGTTRICATCGNVMSETDKFDLPAQQELIKDEKEIAQAQVGPDITCKYCGARNRADATNCSQCSADLKEGASRKAGEVLGAFDAAPKPDVKCPYCGALNPANALKCQNCAGSLAKRPTDQPVPKPVAAPKKSGGMNKLIVVGVIAVIGIILFMLFRTTDTSAAVQSVQWQRSIEILEQRPVTHQTWQDQVPTGAQRGSCTEKVRSTQNDPAPNSDKICGTPYTIDQGNGTAKVVQDCKYQVKDQWCDYTQPEWIVIDAVVEQGNDLKPRDPALSLRADQREGDHTETYEVVFSSEGKQYKYSPGNASDFAQFTIGSRWTLKVNALGGVTSVQAAK